MSLACASWETRFWHAWWPHMRGTPAEATGCLVENHAELVGFDTLLTVSWTAKATRFGTRLAAVPFMHHLLDRASRRVFLDSISTPSSRMHVAYAFRMHSCVLACLSLPVQLPACVHTLVFGDLVWIFFLYKSLKKRFIWGWSWFEVFSFTNL